MLLRRVHWIRHLDSKIRAVLIHFDATCLCLSISRCIDAASLPGSGGTLRAATESQSSVHPPGCLVRPFRDCPGRCGTGYAVPPGTRRSASGGAPRVPHARDLTRLFCTRLLCLGLSRGPRPSDCFAGFIVHPCTRCSQGSPFGFTFGGYNSTTPWSRFRALVVTLSLFNSFNAASHDFRYSQCKFWVESSVPQREREFRPPLSSLS